MAKGSKKRNNWRPLALEVRLQLYTGVQAVRERAMHRALVCVRGAASLVCDLSRHPARTPRRVYPASAPVVTLPSALGNNLLVAGIILLWFF